VVGKQGVKTDVLRDLNEARAKRDAQELAQGVKRTIAHLEDIAKLSVENYQRKNAVLDAATTGNDPKINELAKKKAAVSSVPKSPKMDCSGGVCRIVRKKTK
jgi:hypothetical protein